MNKIQAKRLLNVAKSMRESPIPKAFDMEIYVRGEMGDNVKENWCGTPGCALGHYASRRDLQRLMKIKLVDCGYGDSYDIVYNSNERKEVCIGDPSQELLDHFGINMVELGDLFSGDGCNGAKTPIQAARYIEKFVKEKRSA